MVEGEQIILETKDLAVAVADVLLAEKVVEMLVDLVEVVDRDTLIHLLEVQHCLVDLTQALQEILQIRREVQLGHLHKLVE